MATSKSPKTNQKKEPEFTIFSQLPPEMRLMVLKEASPGPQLIILMEPGYLYTDFTQEFVSLAQPPIPSVLHANREFRHEVQKKYEVMTNPKGDWKRYINYERDTFLLASAYEGFLKKEIAKETIPEQNIRIKHLMLMIHYAHDLPFCAENGNGDMSDEIEWDVLRTAFPNLEELVIWTSDFLLGEDYPSEKLRERWRHGPRYGWEYKNLDFPWWESNSELHREIFQDIEEDQSEGYRVMREVTERQFAVVKKRYPEWPLKKIRWIGGLGAFYVEG